ncbi:hypothetical protein STRMA_0013 [Streptococcus macacae NCTC 11558]|uniref:Uncharacterized protein n=1 Tax=Streptococcus macacae NCTC 11558 TaxID=764298 RepID=G5JXW8_9STRE|nr:hypothetical protein STRMA_0013 [Streptococcus macacae NCTC 11558]
MENHKVKSLSFNGKRIQICSLEEDNALLDLSLKKLLFF